MPDTTSADRNMAAQYAETCRRIEALTTDSPEANALTILDAPVLAHLEAIDWAHLGALLTRLAKT